MMLLGRNAVGSISNHKLMPAKLRSALILGSTMCQQLEGTHFSSWRAAEAAHSARMSRNVQVSASSGIRYPPMPSVNSMS